MNVCIQEFKIYRTKSEVNCRWEKRKSFTLEGTIMSRRKRILILAYTYVLYV
uniref:Uncharacterized protein n=1 Tax=Arundo donax TaxID=35708 RepID=A0A0A9FK20_ARUDO